MDTNSLNDLKKRTELGSNLQFRIKKYNKWIESIKNQDVDSVWINNELVYLKENCATTSIQDVCTDEEAKELSEIITNYLVEKLKKKKNELEKLFESI